MQFTATANLANLRGFLNAVQVESLPFATAIALTATAKYGRKQIVQEMQRVFDKPKPTTVSENNGPLYLKSADYKKLRAGEDDYAEVRVKDQSIGRTGSGGNSDPAIVWLSHNLYGGQRVQKRSEFLLQKAGVLPPGYWTVPAVGAKYDQYGNMSIAQINQILSAVSANLDKWQNSYYTDTYGVMRKSRGRQFGGIADYFLVNRNNPRTSHLSPEGIWQRYGKGKYEVKPVLLFVRRAPRYRQRIRFFEILDGVARFRFQTEFNIAMRNAIATSQRQFAAAA